ncbi:hypothetical protein LWI29_022826 [Acer saccharum]|uniref:Uncharacterized protein n=1 Tax=Acer saccharum TaxID=4024 RepID=A0AA39SED7_ACESA|nr:hypothetical protein LWI29_022826 [Acer saccharum]
MDGGKELVGGNGRIRDAQGVNGVEETTIEMGNTRERMMITRQQESPSSGERSYQADGNTFCSSKIYQKLALSSPLYYPRTKEEEKLMTADDILSPKWYLFPNKPQKQEVLKFSTIADINRVSSTLLAKLSTDAEKQT